jgi:hypothetical protein
VKRRTEARGFMMTPEATEKIEAGAEAGRTAGEEEGVSEAAALT